MSTPTTAEGHLSLSPVGRSTGEVADPEQVCRTCGARYPDAGDGYDGQCPTCADRTAARTDGLGEPLPTRTWNQHSDDTGTWCPFSGCTPAAHVSNDRRCPQGCADSRIEDRDQ